VKLPFAAKVAARVPPVVTFITSAAEK
jgi:hypothetical protein